MRKSFNQKIKKLSSSFIVVLLVCMNFLIHLPYKAEAATTELKGLGDVSYYNAIIFGDHSATSADIEGAMAVQKNMNASSYTVVAAATGANNLAGATWVDEGYPSLLLGGQFTKAGTGQVIIQDGTVAMTKDGDPEGAMKSSYDRISYKEQAEIDAKFKEFRKDINSVIEDAGQLHTDKPKPGMTFGIGEDVKNSNIYVSSGLKGQEPFNVKDVYLPNVNNKDFIVIHSDAEEVNFGGGAILYDTTDKGGFTLVNTSQAYDPNSFFTELASKVIWVFPNAKKITTKGYGVVGSVFAPNAVVETKGGSINGQAFVGGLHQRDGFEVHNFKFNWPKWKKPAAEKGNLQIKKVDENDENIVLKDAKFDVIDKDNNVVATVTTNEKGIAEVKDLPFGDYFVKEISAPEGYIKVDTPVKVTIDNTNIIEFVMKNTKKVENGQFKLLKKDSESGQLLPGAKFDVIDKDGKVVETIVTDDKGEALSKQLPVGSYTLKEVEAPKGYELSSSSVSVDVEVNKVVTVDVVNKKIPEKVTGQFEIVKVDAEDKTKVLSDAEFEVYKDGKKVDTLRTDKTGKVVSQKLEPGKYTLKETKAPQGYKLLKEEIEVVVEANKVVQVQVENAKELGSLQVTKKDAESGKVLEGAEFRLKNENGQVVGETKTTNKDGVVKFENLVPGKYTLEETKAPEGYKAVEVTVEVNVVANEVVKQEVMNEKLTGQFEIVKVDAEDKAKVLSDAEFEVYKDGKKVETLRTDKTGKVISQKLEPGTYTLKETKAPQGYKLLKEEIEVVVEANKVVEVQVENAKELGSLQVIKKDAESGKVLEGAEFKLKNETGQVVGETKTTNKDGVVKFENLVPGKYTLEETKAPEGYKAVEVTVEVNVVANEVVKQEVMNEKVTGQFEIIKVDANDKAKVLSDAEFTVYKDGKKVAELKTDESGKVMSPKLPLGEYTVKETKAPEGYKLSNKEWKVTIQNEKEVVKVEAENERILGSLQIIKTDDKDQAKRLSGAEFTLKDAQGNVVKEGITTDKSGIVKVDGLVPGEYTLEETKAPEGYELTKQVIHVTVDGEKIVDVKVTNSKSLGQFEIVKVDAEDKAKVLSDAEFEVYKDGKKVETLRTDKTGKVISQKLEPGTYTLKETKAPQGYKLLKEEIEVVVEANKVVQVQVENAKELGSLQVIKKDAESGKVLEGAEFKLKNETGQVVGETKTTNKDGVVKFENLVPGKYTLEETKAPEGYKALEVTVEVNVVANTVIKQEVLNEKVKEKIKGQVEITKVDATDTNKKLAGAVFEILKDGTKIDTLTTDKNGKATSKELEPGDYILKEVQAPEGYELSDKGIEFTISNQKIEVVKLQITNEKETSKGPENPGGETETPGGETETPGGETETPGEETEKPGEETEKPGEETEKPGEETGKPGEETEKPGEETGKPGEETEKPGEETGTSGEETEKPGGETGTPSEGMENVDKEKPTLPEKGQGASHAQLPATGHDMNYLPFIGFALVLLGIRLRFMIKNS
ncbi:SpaA isopeptide-forming pilin-related protein [Bacillus pacificus]|uniref:SpaA isopeptide-forming pilin-related protein n=2 Tax=Bacillus pacificus TaxID=2026187 RepID=A0AAP5L4V9_9BACI|nr:MULTISPECIES: SpaA isopeptide-forming pilin-related protein [Bacillus cereus group]MCU5159062.1 SpaA isopeptide-forming pilin-related protein [Bacillus pacificus]MCU9945363.1 SpaA isopeptide-forming pilin-related protein [Bacillus pacificus]MDA1689988.1 SpaA isopeptide-forming pilin-related protein [Bacillus cereus group sp. TH147LC]MDK7389476.1 SpaA isopeptide-forming pilin-related protein [Bacillus pacificus]MDK7394967.1 SpaA isopeptide-forming pilin-related protein [Bacillus pacificus]